jgi:hypothetical protein
MTNTTIADEKISISLKEMTWLSLIQLRQIELTSYIATNVALFRQPPKVV